MATNTTAIEWTDRTWNPVTGCTKVSPGCDNCYAETIATRFAGSAAFPKGFDVQVRKNVVNAPLKWRKPARIFVNSMSDLFHADVPTPWLADIFAVMAAAERHTFQVLTKRHGRMRSLLSDASFVDDVRSRALGKGLSVDRWEWPLRNVWLGVSVENQQWADIRIPALLGTPAAVRFLSCEPLLGPVDLWGPLKDGCHRPKLTYWLDGRPQLDEGYTTATGLEMHGFTKGPRIDWVIVGGESGRGARPMHPDWVLTIRDQCQHSGVAFLFKQAGSVLARELGLKGKGSDFDSLPIEFQVREYPHD
jgi:protein gp37